VSFDIHAGPQQETCDRDIERYHAYRSLLVYIGLFCRSLSETCDRDIELSSLGIHNILIRGRDRVWGGGGNGKGGRVGGFF